MSATPTSVPILRTDEPLEMLFNIGDRVRTTKYGDGVVRYFGPHKAGKPGMYVGVELDNPVGRMSGKIKEDRYFATKPDHGALVLARKVQLVDRAADFAVGDMVKCETLGIGLVTYFGPHAQKAWFLRVGIALLEKNGVHDGTVDDHAYFSCEDGHGILVKPEKVEVLMAGFATSSKWHQKVFMKGVAKEAAAEALVQKKRDEEDKKLEKKKKKDLLTGRYQQPSTGFADSDAAVKADEGVKVKHSSGGDGEAASTQAPPLVRHSDTQDEYDPQAQYAVSAEHVGTLRRKVGSRTYLFEQVGDEHAESVVSKSFGSLSGMYVEVATWTFWNQQSADTYLAKWTDVLEDDRAAEAYTGVFKKPASADDGKEVSYIVLNIGTCQQFVNLYGEGNSYQLIEEALGEKFEDRVQAKQMAKSNGMRRMVSKVYTVKGHAKLDGIAAQWQATSKDYHCSIVDYPGVSLVGGWRTVASFCKKSNWVGVIGDFAFANSGHKDKFLKEAHKLSAEPVSKAKGVDKEKLRGQIEPVTINVAPSAEVCTTIGFFEGAIWGSQQSQGLDKVTDATVFVIGPGTATHEVQKKIATINANSSTTCVTLTEVQ